MIIRPFQHIIAQLFIFGVKEHIIAIQPDSYCLFNWSNNEFLYLITHSQLDLYDFRI